MSTDKTPKPATSRGEEILRLIQSETQRLLGPGVKVHLNLGSQEASVEGQELKFTFKPRERDETTDPSGI